MIILFMDICGFILILEQFIFIELVSFLNILLLLFFDVIQDWDGIIDKYIGDSIMVFWNVLVLVLNYVE